MKTIQALAFALSALALAVSAAYADTTNSNKGQATMEQKASPAAAKSDEERAEASQGQPDVPHAGGTTARTTKKAAPKTTTTKKGKKEGSSSTGSSAPTSGLSTQQEQAFKNYDVDGDSSISKAEAAGNEDLVTKFDRADGNHDGQLSRAEFANLDKKPHAPKQARVQGSGR